MAAVTVLTPGGQTIEHHTISKLASQAIDREGFLISNSPLLHLNIVLLSMIEIENHNLKLEGLKKALTAAAHCQK